MLEFLPELFDTLREEAYSLTESEAAIFLPCLVEKVHYIFLLEELVAYINIICNLVNILLKNSWDIIFLSLGYFCIAGFRAFSMWCVICHHPLREV